MTAIPVKRVALPHPASSDAKSPRLQGMDTANSDHRPTTTATTTTTKARTALAAATKGIRKPAGFNHVLVNFFDAILEERNYEEALLALEGMIAHHQIPHQTHIRQLLSLSLSTLSSLGGPTTTTSTTSLTPTVSSTTLDPIPLTERKLRLQALHLLERIARSNSVQSILRSIPGHAPKDPLLQALYEDYLPSSRLDEDPLNDDRLDEVIIDEAEDDDTELIVSARRMAQRTTCEDVWALLGGSADRVPKTRDKDRPLTKGGWETLAMLVASWEDEQRMKVQAANGMRKVSFAPSLMQTFKSNSIGIREVSPRMLDIVFWPFSKVATDCHAQDSTFHEEEENESHNERLFEMELTEKRRIARRMLALVSNAAVIGRLTHLAWVGDIAGRMRDLSLTSLSSFLEVRCRPYLPPVLAALAHNYTSYPEQHFGTTSHPHFVIRVLSRYIELTSHPLHPLQLPTTTISTSEAHPATPSIPSYPSGIHASPRRRPMSQHSSFVGIETNPPPSAALDLGFALQRLTNSEIAESSMTTTSVTPPMVVLPLEIPYFSTRLSLPAILQLLRAVPTQLSPNEATIPQAQEGPTGPPRPRSAAATGGGAHSQSKRTSVVEEALKRSGLVKRYLVEGWGLDGHGNGNGIERDVESCEKVLEEVEKGLWKGLLE